MTEQKDINRQLLSDDLRLTKFGKLLRSTSLDELPELFNILRGDTSIVRPRPLLVQYLSLYNTHQKWRHVVMPGLTGLAQVNGRNAITWKEKFELDVDYVESVGFIKDCKVILLTFKQIFTRKGINQEGTATVEYFKGNLEE